MRVDTERHRALDSGRPRPASRSRVGPKGLGPLRALQGRYLCPRAAPDGPGPRRRRVAGLGVRAGRGRLPGPVLRGRLRPHHPWPHRHPGLAARACVRGRVLLRAHLVDACRRRRRLGGARPVESIFYGLLGSVTAVLGRRRLWPLWVAAAWVTMEVVRSSWPFSGMPWGRLAFATVDTPVAAALAYVGSVGVSFLLALLGCRWPPLVPAGGRRVAAVALLGVAALAVVPALAPYEPTPDST